MNLDSLIKRGQPPWRPKLEATDLEVWHEYEIPLIGTFRLNEQLVLFTQVMESDRGLSAWAYVCLGAEDLSGVEFVSIDEMRDFVEAKFLGREAVLALAKDDLLGQWTRQTVANSLRNALEDFLNGIIKSVNEVPDTERRIRAKFAGLEAAEDELELV